MATRIEWITDVERLRSVEPHWDRLADRDPSPFSRIAWLDAWLGAFRGGRPLRACTTWEGSQLTAAVCLLDGGRHGLRPAANVHTPTFRPLFANPSARAALAGALATAERALALEALPEEDGVEELLSDMASAGLRIARRPAYRSPITETLGSFDAYRNALKPGWRELERRGRKLARERDVQLEPIATPSDLKRGLSEGLKLELAGWKGRLGTAIAAREDTAGFYSDMALAFERRDALRLSTLRVDGRLAAFDLALVHNNRYFLLKTAYDERLRSFSPGLVLRRAVIERCFELGLDAHEFLGADMAWKRLFATTNRTHCSCHAYPPGIVGGLGYAYRRHARPPARTLYRALRRR